jgi:hypothetical protein
MKATEIIETLLSSYEEQLNIETQDKKRIFQGMKNVKEVFEYVEHPQVVRELIGVMMQPRNESSFVNEVKQIWKTSRKVTIRTQRGMGLVEDTDKQLEILEFVNSDTFRVKDFGKAMAKRLGERMTKYKS